MTQVFLSYSIVDIELATRLAEDLAAAGFDIWKAPESIDPGAGWVASIENGLTTSTHFVLVMSPASVQSKWVRFETNAAIALERRGKLVIIPLAYRDCEPPLFWQVYQHVELDDDYSTGLMSLIKRLNAEQPKLPPQVNQSVALAQSSVGGDVNVAGGNIIINNYVVREEERPPDPPQEPSRDDLKSDVDIEVLPAPAPPDTGEQLVEKEAPEPPSIAETHGSISTMALLSAGQVLEVLPGPFEWAEVQAGSVTLESAPAATFEVEPCLLSRYPITYDQFQTFLDADDGFVSSLWWRSLAADLDHRKVPGRQAFKVGNHPRENVSWYDAMAFCAWLSDRLGYEVRLPTEWEWQRAAQGDDGRRYPWGDDDPTDEHANWANSLGQTTPVTAHPLGESPVGAMDMAGNVWEWCLNEFHKPANTQITGTNHRTLRGGSWPYPDLSYLRAACRGKSRPGNRSITVGFRIARPLGS